jgi:hypothetical protein
MFFYNQPRSHHFGASLVGDDLRYVEAPFVIRMIPSANIGNTTTLWKVPPQ